MIDVNDCIEWDRATNGRGYGRAYVPGQGMQYVHRLAYAEVHGPIPNDLEIDHLCRNRACFNVDHLEAVTHRVNSERGPATHNLDKTHCPAGHPYSGDNLRMEGTRRRCRTCHLDATRRHRARSS